jgi:para-aminobenzoate synthetase component 1
MVFLDADYNRLRAQLLAWAVQHPQCAVLDSCGQPDAHGQWRLLVAVRTDTISSQTPPPLGAGWHFGGIGYGYRHALEPQLPPPQAATAPFPQLLFFEATTVLGIPHGGNAVVCLQGEMPDLSQIAPRAHELPPPLPLHDALPREAYAQAFAQTRRAIQTGEVYELNLCRPFAATIPGLDTVALWAWLVARSPVPMGAYLQLGGQWVVMSASPERFLQHRGGLLVTQPIKGTVRRLPDAAADAAACARLRQDPKVRAENLMIADLARNDLSRVCVHGTVQAQLCHTLSLSTLHHLVSTVLGVLHPAHTPWQAVQAAFPPGSMTGAPKVRAMALIHELEPEERGLYSGAVGYWGPQGQFDFNVVIRSYIYHSTSGRLSTHVGGAITWDSEEALEYAETETKALALRH